MKKYNKLGYDLEDIRTLLSKEEFTEFTRWIGGQTVGLIDGKTIIYSWDWEKWKGQKEHENK